jgi:hypothetical protein
MLVLADENPTWWAQPLATLIAAALVYHGVRTTLKGNATRLREQQVKDRAKEREQKLQELYSDFSVAAFDLPMLSMQMAVADVAIRTAETSTDQNKGARINAARAEYKSHDQKRESLRVSIAAVISRIRLFDDNTARLARLVDLRAQLINLPKTAETVPGDTVEERMAFVLKTYDKIEDFITGVASELEVEYRQTADYAMQGAHPPVVVRNSNLERKEAIAELEQAGAKRKKSASDPSPPQT